MADVGSTESEVDIPGYTAPELRQLFAYASHEKVDEKVMALAKIRLTPEDQEELAERLATRLKLLMVGNNDAAIDRVLSRLGDQPKLFPEVANLLNDMVCAHVNTPPNATAEEHILAIAPYLMSRAAGTHTTAALPFIMLATQLIESLGDVGLDSAKEIPLYAHPTGQFLHSLVVIFGAKLRDAERKELLFPPLAETAELIANAVQLHDNQITPEEYVASLQLEPQPIRDALMQHLAFCIQQCQEPPPTARKALFLHNLYSTDNTALKGVLQTLGVDASQWNASLSAALEMELPSLHGSPHTEADIADFQQIAMYVASNPAAIQRIADPELRALLGSVESTYAFLESATLLEEGMSDPELRQEAIGIAFALRVGPATIAPQDPSTGRPKWRHHTLMTLPRTLEFARTDDPPGWTVRILHKSKGLLTGGTITVAGITRPEVATAAYGAYKKASWVTELLCRDDDRIHVGPPAIRLTLIEPKEEISTEERGEPVDVWLKKNHTLGQRIRILASLARQMKSDFLQKGVVHRDLKWNNALFMRNGRVNIIDRDRQLSAGASSEKPFGTRGYIPPDAIEEYATTGTTTARHSDDAFALGSMILEMLGMSPTWADATKRYWALARDAPLSPACTQARTDMLSDIETCRTSLAGQQRPGEDWRTASLRSIARACLNPDRELRRSLADALHFLIELDEPPVESTPPPVAPSPQAIPTPPVDYHSPNVS